MMPRQKSHCQQEHEDRPDDPVLNKRQDEHLDVAKDPGQLFVADLCQGWIHHQYQSNGNGYIGRPHLEVIDHLSDVRIEVATQDTDEHGQKNPEG